MVKSGDLKRLNMYSVADAFTLVATVSMDAEITSLAVSAHSRFVVLNSSNGHALFDVSAGNLDTQIQSPTPGHLLAVSPDETKFIYDDMHSDHDLLCYARRDGQFSSFGTLPSSGGAGRQAFYSPDGALLTVVAGGNGVWPKTYAIAGPKYRTTGGNVRASQSDATIHGFAFNADATRVAIGVENGTTKQTEIYARTSTVQDFLEFDGVGASLAVATGTSPAISGDGNYAAVRLSAAPWVAVLKKSAGQWGLLSNGLSGVTSQALSLAWNGSSHLSVGLASAPYLITYRRSGDNLTALDSPANMPTQPVDAVLWSPNGDYLLVASRDAVHFRVFKRGADQGVSYYGRWNVNFSAGSTLEYIQWRQDSAWFLAGKTGGGGFSVGTVKLTAGEMTRDATVFPAYTVAFTPDNKAIFEFENNGTFRIGRMLKKADADSYETNVTYFSSGFSNNRARATTCAWLNDGLTLLALVYDGTSSYSLAVYTYDPAAITLTLHPASVLALPHQASTIRIVGDNRFELLPASTINDVLQGYVEMGKVMPSLALSSSVDGEQVWGYSSVDDAFAHGSDSVGRYTRANGSVLTTAKYAAQPASDVTLTSFSPDGSKCVYSYQGKIGYSYALGINWIVQNDIPATVVDLYKLQGNALVLFDQLVEELGTVISNVKFSYTPVFLTYAAKFDGVMSVKLVDLTQADYVSLVGEASGTWDKIYSDFSPFETYFGFTTHQTNGSDEIHLVGTPNNLSFDELDIQSVGFGPLSFSGCDDVIVASGGSNPFTLFKIVNDKLDLRSLTETVEPPADNSAADAGIVFEEPPPVSSGGYIDLSDLPPPAGASVELTQAEASALSAQTDDTSLPAIDWSITQVLDLNIMSGCEDIIILTPNGPIILKMKNGKFQVEDALLDEETEASQDSVIRTHDDEKIVEYYDPKDNGNDHSSGGGGGGGYGSSFNWQNSRLTPREYFPYVAVNVTFRR